MSVWCAHRFQNSGISPSQHQQHLDGDREIDEPPSTADVEMRIAAAQQAQSQQPQPDSGRTTPHCSATDDVRDTTHQQQAKRSTAVMRRSDHPTQWFNIDGGSDAVDDELCGTAQAQLILQLLEKTVSQPMLQTIVDPPPDIMARAAARTQAAMA